MKDKPSIDNDNVPQEELLDEPGPTPLAYQRLSVKERVMLEKWETANKRRGQPSPPAFTPVAMFFYGSLMDPHLLQTILNLPETPVMRSASVTGFTMKMWGMYPTLVQRDCGRKIHGQIWEVKTHMHFLKLFKYETWAYQPVKCRAEVAGEVIECETFCWRGDPDSAELTDGEFDLEYYTTIIKPLLAGQPGNV